MVFSNHVPLLSFVWKEVMIFLSPEMMTFWDCLKTMIFETSHLIWQSSCLFCHCMMIPFSFIMVEGQRKVILRKCLRDMASKISWKSQTNLLEQTPYCLSFISVWKGKDFGGKASLVVLKYFPLSFMNCPKAFFFFVLKSGKKKNSSRKAVLIFKLVPICIYVIA